MVTDHAFRAHEARRNVISTMQRGPNMLAEPCNRSVAAPSNPFTSTSMSNPFNRHAMTPSNNTFPGVMASSGSGGGPFPFDGTFTTLNTNPNPFTTHSTSFSSNLNPFNIITGNTTQAMEIIGPYCTQSQGETISLPREVLENRNFPLLGRIPAEIFAKDLPKYESNVWTLGQIPELPPPLSR